MCVSINGTGDLDRLTLKLVRESHLRWRIFSPNLGTLGLLVLELFAMYTTDGQTDGQATLIVPFPTGGGIIMIDDVTFGQSLNLGCLAARSPCQ